MFDFIDNISIGEILLFIAILLLIGFIIDLYNNKKKSDKDKKTWQKIETIACIGLIIYVSIRSCIHFGLWGLALFLLIFFII